MSFKEVRDLAEDLKMLGYPNPFPLQALSTKFGSLASFCVVAEVLQWLAGMLDPGTVLPGSTETTDERLALIRAAVAFFVTKSGAKLNPRKLYAACNVSAGELRKVTRLLIEPTQAQASELDEEDVDYRSASQVDIGDKLESLRRARDLSSSLTQRGASLYDMLSKVLVDKESNLSPQAGRFMELDQVERSLKNAISSAQAKLQTSRAQVETARTELVAFNSKLQRKRAELDRTKQRLEALQKIRPAHMQEFEDCEKEIQGLFQEYFVRLTVRDALRAQLEARAKHNTPINSPSPQKTGDNSMPFIPEGLIADDDDDEFDEPVLDGSVGLPRAQGGFGLDSEIPDIRDEDLMLRESGGYDGDNTATARKPSSTSNSRIRPTTGRSRKPMLSSQRVSNGRAGPGSSMLSNRVGRNADEDDSTFGSSESELDMSGLMGYGDPNSSTAANILGNLDQKIAGIPDDDWVNEMIIKLFS